MKLFRLSFLVAAFTVAASAQDIEFGAHGGLSIPVGDLSRQVDGRVGLTIGGHAGIYYGNGHEVRPRLEYLRFEGGWQRLANGRFERSNVYAFSLGADYLYYMATCPQGLFLAMGLNLQKWTVVPDGAASESKGCLGVAIGGGHRFNKAIALEGRYITGQFKSTNGEAGAFQAIASVRF